jgi:hypothetical protein
MIKKLQHSLILFFFLNGGVLGCKTITTLRPEQIQLLEDWLYGGCCDNIYKNLSCLMVIVVASFVSFVR